MAADLLPEFTISTKVGFFSGARGTEHSLDPRRLRQAVETSVGDLGQSPDVMLLHNPERSLVALSPEEGRDCLAAACSVLGETSAAGLCGSWGIASWDPRPLLAVVTSPRATAIPVPDVLMTRAGLLVGAGVLDACDAIAAWCGLDTSARWGMSPFAGRSTDPVWSAVNLHTFLEPGQKYSIPQAAFRISYELPPVGRMVVGTTSVEHLRELVAARWLRIDKIRIARYRELLRVKAATLKK